MVHVKQENENRTRQENLDSIKQLFCLILVDIKLFTLNTFLKLYYLNIIHTIAHEFSCSSLSCNHCLAFLPLSWRNEAELD